MTDKELDELVDFILDNGSIDGAHHKQWVLDQVLRKILKSDYNIIIYNFELNDYEWDEGIAP